MSADRPAANQSIQPDAALSRMTTLACASAIASMLYVVSAYAPAAGRMDLGSVAYAFIQTSLLALPMISLLGCAKPLMVRRRLQPQLTVVSASACPSYSVLAFLFALLLP